MCAGVDKHAALLTGISGHDSETGGLLVLWVSLWVHAAKQGAAMKTTSALLRRDMEVSMNRTVIESDPTANGTRCWPFMADPAGRNCTNVKVQNVEITPWRTYAEWMYSGVCAQMQLQLTKVQAFRPRCWAVANTGSGYPCKIEPGVLMLSVLFCFLLMLNGQVCSAKHKSTICTGTLSRAT